MIWIEYSTRKYNLISVKVRKVRSVCVICSSRTSNL